ncbi:hypothetical protein PO124_22995 [Bacillus licheniformis]|nr:hypothetical protein [Bacillus licheniformis]
MAAKLAVGYTLAELKIRSQIRPMQASSLRLTMSSSNFRAGRSTNSNKPTASSARNESDRGSHGD